MIQTVGTFPDERSSTLWFEGHCLSEGRRCGHCGSRRNSEVPNAVRMAYWCAERRSYFSVRSGTPLAQRRVSLRTWVSVIDLCATSKKGVSSMKLHRGIGDTKRRGTDQLDDWLRNARSFLGYW